MVSVLQNKHLTVKISHIGAEILSVLADGFEFMHAPTENWGATAPLLFPICGRLLNSEYSLGGKKFNMNIHGFISKEVFRVVSSSDTELTLVATESPATIAAYPFEFMMCVKYSLRGTSLSAEYTVTNRSGSVMPFMFGLHPGFVLPMEEGAAFDDYRLDLGVSEVLHYPLINGAFVSKASSCRPLVDGKLQISEEEICREQTLVFGGIGQSARLYREGGKRAVSISFSDGFPFLCLWKHPSPDERYLCIEPWSGVPSDGNFDECFDTRENMLRIEPGASARFFSDFRFEF